MSWIPNLFIDTCKLFSEINSKTALPNPPIKLESSTVQIISWFLISLINKLLSRGFANLA